MTARCHLVCEYLKAQIFLHIYDFSQIKDMFESVMRFILQAEV
jgi:hypothetical protein